MQCHSLLRTTFLDILSVLVCSGCQNRIPQTRWLKQQQFIFPPFWRLEAKIKVLADLVSPGALQMAIFFLCHHMAFFFFPCVVLLLVSPRLLIRTPAFLNQGPTLMTPFNLSYPLRGPVSKYTILGVRVSTYEFWGDTIHSKTQLHVHHLNLLILHFFSGLVGSSRLNIAFLVHGNDNYDAYCFRITLHLAVYFYVNAQQFFLTVSFLFFFESNFLKSGKHFKFIKKNTKDCVANIHGSPTQL